MTRGYSTEAVGRRDVALAEGLFKPYLRSGYSTISEKVECVTCGLRGYPGGSWMDRCIAGHVKCPDCPRIVPKASLKQHRSHRSHP